VGSIHYDFIGIFHCLNLLGSFMALGSTQLLTKISKINISWGGGGGGYGGLCVGRANFSPSFNNCFEIRGPPHAGKFWVYIRHFAEPVLLLVLHSACL
jgi:hypothetical protein